MESCVACQRMPPTMTTTTIMTMARKSKLQTIDFVPKLEAVLFERDQRGLGRSEKEVTRMNDSNLSKSICHGSISFLHSFIFQLYNYFI